MQTTLTLKELSKENHPYHSFYEKKHHIQLTGINKHGFIDKDGNSRIQGHPGCHSGFEGIEDALYSWNIFYNYRENQPFLSWITDPIESPWRDVLENSILIKDGNNKTLAIFIDGNQNGYITCNLYIAARQASEYNTGDTWEYLVTNEIKKDIAFILTEFSKGKFPLKFSFGDSSHKAINYYNSNKFNLKRFLKKEPQKEKKEETNPYETIKNGPYNKGGGRNYCNFIWTDENTNFKKKIESILNEIGTKKEIEKSQFEIITTQPIQNMKELLIFQEHLLKEK
jgi:hypothetical protein